MSQPQQEQQQQQSAKPRLVFISASYLVDEYKFVPKDEMDNAIFFLGSARHWIFPSSDEERKDSLRQPTKYLEFPQEFKDLMLAKEKQGLLFFLKPENSYAKVSKFFEGIADPVRPGENYKPLILDSEWWLNAANQKKFKYCASGKSVVMNFQSGSHGYGQTMELLEQSNPTLKAKLVVNA